MLTPVTPAGYCCNHFRRSIDCYSLMSRSLSPLAVVAVGFPVFSCWWLIVAFSRYCHQIAEWRQLLPTPPQQHSNTVTAAFLCAVVTLLQSPSFNIFTALLRLPLVIGNRHLLHVFVIAAVMLLCPFPIIVVLLWKCAIGPT